MGGWEELGGGGRRRWVRARVRVACARARARAGQGRAGQAGFPQTSANYANSVCVVCVSLRKFAGFA